MAASAFALIAATPASAEMDDLVRRAVMLEQSGKQAEAYALLAPSAESRAGDPDFDYALGIAAADTGHGPVAILAFQRVLALQPRNAQARAELARVYAQAGDIDTAKREFDTVVDDPSLPDPVRQRFNRIVRDLGREQHAGGTGISGFVEASGGYDSNINTATGLTSITLPIFAALGPATLSGGATKIDDSFLSAEGGLSIASGVSRQTRVFGSLLGNWRDNRNSKTFDQALATVTGGVGHTLANRDVLSVSGQYQQFWLSHARYREAYGATAQYTRRLDGGRALSLSAQWFRLDYRTDPLRDADRFSLAATYVGRAAYFGLSGGHEQTRNAASDNLSNLFVGGRAGLEKPVAARVSVVGGAGVEYRRYDAADPLFLKQRDDWQLDASVGLKLLVAPSIYVRPSVSYTRNISNIGLFDYDRVVASVGIRTEF